MKINNLNLEKSPSSNFMKFIKSNFRLLTIFSSLFVSSLITEKYSSSAYAGPICPDPSTTPITSIYNPSDANSFHNLTKDGDDQGFCRGTPEKYGVTVYKMGFCAKNPGNPSGTVLAGTSPDYSSCTWAYENLSGETADFSAGGSIDLSKTYSKSPSEGTYPHAVMLISKDFRIKGTYGPVAGNTYYSTNTFGVSSTDINDYGTTIAPLKTFSGPGSCEAYTEGESVVGGTISAYLIDASGSMLTNNSSVAECSGQVQLLGVMNMSSDLTISSATKGLEMTFVVSDNGMSVMSNQTGTSILFDSGPFSVNFETF